jgi:pSer/pThr/pTyr-binding forkhead associated (FHA) protein
MNEKQITLGRAKGNDVVIPDKTVSSYHARIIITPTGYEIEDMGSSNGTRVNGKLVSRADIDVNDEIQLGNYTLPKRKLEELLSKPNEPTMIVSDLRPNALYRHKKFLQYGIAVVILLALFVGGYFFLPGVRSRELAPSEIFKRYRNGTVLIRHRYIGVKGGMFLCEKSELLQEAAEEMEYEIVTRPDLAYAIVPDRDFAEKFAFEVWGTGIRISDSGEILTYRKLADPKYCLEPFEMELSTRFNGETIDLDLWMFGMSVEEAGIDAKTMEVNYLPENEIGLIKLTSTKPEISSIQRENIADMEEIEALNPVVMVGYACPVKEGVLSVGKIIPISVSGKVSGVGDNTINYNLEEETVILPGTPIFDLEGNLVAVNGECTDDYNYGINPISFLSGK